MALQNAPFAAGVYESSGVVKVNGVDIPYNTISQDNLLYDEAGTAIGSVFTYSYFRSDVADTSQRPVVFFFNGGPGAGSLWLHAGLFGPLRMVFQDNPEAVNTPHAPPYYIANNDWCLLDIADLVFFDPVGTGWGRLINKEAGTRFFGIDEDAESLKVIIHTWVNHYKRWNSPKYILGESYGTVRAAVLSDVLTGQGANLSSMGLNGIVLLGNAMGNADSMLKFNMEDAILALPTMAAAHWYHNRERDHITCTLKEFVDECYAFCDQEYLLALWAGHTLDPAAKEKIAERISYFTGISKHDVLKQDIRPDMRLSWQQVIEDQFAEIGRLDGRFTLPYGSRSGREGVAICQYTPSFMAAMCGPIKENLKITHDREYYAIARFDGVTWNRKSRNLPYECLSASMRRNNQLRVMFATGYYDMACTIGQARYLARHGGYPIERVEINEYASGHMVYLGEEPAKQFADDVRAFIKI
ncbi:MAG: hypothetical protein FWF06_05080 [Symbiobacteriaceae bacterium]|nr:hypothetical protein [Symbiobacteriaceae bacterium]